MSKLNVSKHPLILDKITQLRDNQTGTPAFRRLVRETGQLLAYEALQDLPTENKQINTPLESTQAPRLAEPLPCFVPILRAGQGMVEGFSDILPEAPVCHVGLERDHETHEPRTYLNKLDYVDVTNRLVVVVDPMLATGGSAGAAIDAVKKSGATHIRFACLVAAPEGVKRLQQEHPDVEIFTAAIDRQLNQNAYIVPGIGDAGDRIFGTEPTRVNADKKAA